MEPIKAPEPGAYRDVPHATYLAWDAVSNSRLQTFARSPAHLQASLKAERKESDSFAIGRALHAAVLEPDRFEKDYTVPERCCAKTKQGKRCSRRGACLLTSGEGWVCEQHLSPDAEIDRKKEVLDAEEFRQVLRMRDAVLRHTVAGVLLRGDGHNELSATWREGELLCKLRADRISTLLAGGTVVDLKTTADASVEAFEKSAWKWGYFRQGAFYLRGLAKLEYEARHFAVVAVEKEPPFGVNVFRLTEGALAAGEEQVERLLAQYGRCVKNNMWPGYPEVIHELSLPVWAWRALEEEMADER